VVAGALAAIKACQIGSLIAMGEAAKESGPPPETVSTAPAQVRAWQSTLSGVGTITGAQSVAVSTEVPGLVTQIRFRSGDVVDKGQTLVELDARKERAELAAAVARHERARVEVARAVPLAARGVIPEAERDNAETALATTAGEVAALRAQLDDKLVRAPFAGRTGILAVDPGQYLAPGTAVTTLESVGGVFVDFTLPQEQAGTVVVGTPVEVAVRGGKPYAGTVTAVDPTIDATTRSIRLRASLPEHGDTLRTGMYVAVTVVLPARTDVVIVPATAIVHASYGDSVFVVEPKPAGSPGMAKTPAGATVHVVRQQFVRTGEMRGDFVVVTEGVTPGQTLVTAGAFKLRNGSPVVIDNRVAPQPSLDPRPENR
jgi:membrane fusion protein (multidrug efflux system)